MTEELTQQALKSVLHYDPDTGLFSWLVNRRRVHVGDPAGTRHKWGYIQIKVGGHFHKAHRLAWLWMTGEWPQDEVDHVNRVRHDNRWANLRAASRSENCRNQRSSERNLTGMRGVYQERATGRYYSQIRIGGGKRLSLGTYDTKEEAVQAREFAVARHHGKFAPT